MPVSPPASPPPGTTRPAARDDSPCWGILHRRGRIAALGAALGVLTVAAVAATQLSSSALASTGHAAPIYAVGTPTLRQVVVFSGVALVVLILLAAFIVDRRITRRATQGWDDTSGGGDADGKRSPEAPRTATVRPRSPAAPTTIRRVPSGAPRPQAAPGAPRPQAAPGAPRPQAAPEALGPPGGPGNVVVAAKRMQFCTNCGVQLASPEHRFCASCGHAVPDRQG